MCIRRKIKEFKKLNIRLNNLSQLPEDIRHAVVEIKDKFKLSLNYEPAIKECLYLLEHDMCMPAICKHEGCNSFSKFNNLQYRYCSKTCSDTDVNRNKAIQEKRKDKINYKEVHAKTVKTKTETIDLTTGLNIHQLASIKTQRARSKNYDSWYNATLNSIQSKTQETKMIASKRREETLINRYGVSHFGGGYSKIKTLTMNNTLFYFQGYEDILIYELLHENINPTDIVTIIRTRDYAFKYEFNNKLHLYFPDIYVKSTNTIYEVKSEYWWNKEIERNRAKLLSVPNTYNTILKIYTKEYANEIRARINQRNC